MGGIVVTIFWFLVVLTPLVFVHEFGHYWFARRAGVRVEVFSVGFGRELFGYTDKAGTRWKFSLVPFGGYVKMFGQSDLGPDDDGADMTDAERAVSFHHKKLSQKTAIVAAGPLANILFAISIFTILFATAGQPFTPAQVSEVVPGSAAEVAGLKSGDEFLEVAGRSIARFEEVQQLIRLHPGIPVDILVDRDGNQLDLVATPSVTVIPDGLGDEARIGVLGVRGLERAFERHSVPVAAWQGVRETVRLVSVTVTAIGQMFGGERSAQELGGPVRIAQMSGSAADAGIATLVVFAAFLSINLGLINLLPIPLLDGGHLAFYAYEAVFRRAPGRWAQELGMKIGLVFVLGLMLFATFNDIVRLPVVQRLVALFT
ncbi:MAG: RIP metalloprotease RseP [Rhodospirillaceae bacterium]|jgi:regulator of sigma E protease|nr:RIP metalloprotease RseP [Rhodospirillaceae bacterium]MBT4771315.1 RIP metalloprotease RseP [Rhodospirillaceae bacterium]MBT5359175.1 RIP metalloprotease RseP [Rhodospirillaceae bacterium]MBT5769045.1 RIP metalloprotease RseP [Rhodospirillaceae bacterium]MBT6310604.1 RIP metalloprotease RseP [Rhodospirillaceae bacterium]